DVPPADDSGASGSDASPPELPAHLRALPRVGDMYTQGPQSLRMFSLHVPPSLAVDGSFGSREAYARHLWAIFDDLVESQSHQFEEFEMIGVGGMGVVIAAKERNIDKWVAFKV